MRSSGSASGARSKKGQAQAMIRIITAPKKNRGYFGALQLGDMVNGTLVYAGRAGTGFDEKKQYTPTPHASWLVTVGATL